MRHIRQVRAQRGQEPMSRPSGTAEDPDAVPTGAVDHAGLVADMLFDLERREIDMPHVVISRHVTTGELSYSGPYSSAISALQAAELEHTLELYGGGDGQITFHVAALYPPLAPGGASAPVP
jgi:hypothetical protein